MKKLLEIDDKVLEIMSNNNDKYMVGKIAEFLQQKGEKLTYNEKEEKYYINTFFPSFPGKAWERLMANVYQIANEDKRIPMQCDIVVTGKCHCRCWHCFRIKDKREDLSLEMIKENIQKLYDMGTVNLGITGGEPMLRPDILEILRSIPDGMEGQLYTTGHNITPEIAKEIKKTNVSRCIISIDHFNASRANDLRHYENAHQEAIEAVHNLVANDIYTAITLCVTDDLLEPGALETYLKFATEIGPHEIRIVLPIPQGNLEGKEVALLYNDAVKFVKEFRKVKAMETEIPTILNFCELESLGFLGCGAGANYISINNDGAITPCVAVGLSFGNIHEKPIEQIYDEMGTYFPRAAQICFGINSGRVKTKENIHLDQTPYPEELSKEIAGKCKGSKRKAAFYEYIKNPV